MRHVTDDDDSLLIIKTERGMASESELRLVLMTLLISLLLMSLFLKADYCSNKRECRMHISHFPLDTAQ